MSVLKNFAQLNSNVHAELNGHLNNMDQKDKLEEAENNLNGLGLASKDANQSEDIVIVGTGDLAKGLLTLLARRGYRVVVASRNPERNRSRVEDLGGEIENYKNALNRGKIVIVAIPLEGFQSLPADLFEGKIVIDVSNRTLKGNANKPSLANQLQELLPGSKVVKAFNTLSAYALQNNIFQGSKEVPIYSDDEEAKSIVVNLVRNLGLMPVDRGSLTSVTEIEGITLALFPDWKLAGKLSLALLIFFFIIQTSRDQICPNIQRSDDKPWDWKLFHKFPLVTIHAASAAVALTLLTSCYLPGVIAAYLQLYRGTKYSEFPKWLDLWMRSRKQIGLMAEFFAAMHTLMAAFDVIRRGVSEWRDFSYIAFGCFAIGLMTILAITSIPSVSESLTWREFSFVQRYLGWWALFFSVVHLIFKKWTKLITSVQRCFILPDVGQMTIILPLATLLLKLILMLPCIDNQVQKIRRGYERPSANQNIA